MKGEPVKSLTLKTQYRLVFCNDNKGYEIMGQYFTIFEVSGWEVKTDLLVDRKKIVTGYCNCLKQETMIDIYIVPVYSKR